LGDLDLNAVEPRAAGDLVRVTEAKGEVEPEKASKPVRLVAVGTEADVSPSANDGAAKGDVNGNFAEEGEVEEGSLESGASLELPPKRF